MSLQLNIKRFRKNKAISQQIVSHELGISQQIVSKWETGKSLPRADMLPKIAKLFGCTVDDLLKQE